MSVCGRFPSVVMPSLNKTLISFLCEGSHALQVGGREGGREGGGRGRGGGGGREGGGGGGEEAKKGVEEEEEKYR